jgi:hypothetical protein
MIQNWRSVYVSNTVGDLTDGSLYMMKRTDDNQRERYGCQSIVWCFFCENENHTTMTGAAINASVNIERNQIWKSRGLGL